MNKYYHAVGLCIGLAAVIILSCANAAFMTPNTEWFANLTKPKVTPVLHSLFWLFSYLITAFTIGEFAINKPLRKFLFLQIIFIVLNVLWCFLFFRVHELISSCVTFSLCLATLGAILVVTIKSTRGLWVAVLCNIVWYMYLFTVFIIVLISN